VNYQWNKLDSIIEHIEQVEAHKYTGRPFWIINCLYTKAFTLNAQGDFDALKLTLMKLNSFANDYDSDLLNMAVKVCEVEISLRRNNIEKALSLSEGVNFDIYPPVFFFYFPQLTHVKLLFSNADPVKMDEAQVRLEKLIGFAQATYRQNLLIAALPIQALIYNKLGKVELAAKILKEALALAEPGNYVRTFLDLGSPMEEMLEKLYKADSNNQYLAGLLKFFKLENKSLAGIKSKKQKSNLGFSGPERDRLSEKEINLLKLVAEGHRNKEIAEKLHLSLDSIKKYLYNIYQKLGVHNRVAAISKTIELGLINQLDNSQ